MLSHKKYMEIQNLNREIGDMFEPGDQIIIKRKSTVPMPAFSMIGKQTA